MRVAQNEGSKQRADVVFSPGGLGGGVPSLLYQWLSRFRSRRVQLFGRSGAASAAEVLPALHAQHKVAGGLGCAAWQGMDPWLECMWEGSSRVMSNVLFREGKPGASSLEP